MSFWEGFTFTYRLFTSPEFRGFFGFVLSLFLFIFLIVAVVIFIQVIFEALVDKMS